MRFLGFKFTQNALAAKALPQTPCRFQGSIRGSRKGKEGKEGGGKGEKGYWEGKEGAKRGGRERGRRRERKGGGVCVIGVRGDRRPWADSGPQLQTFANKPTLYYSKPNIIGIVDLRNGGLTAFGLCSVETR